MAPVRNTRSKAAVQAARKAAKASRSAEMKILKKNVTKSLVATVLEKEKERRKDGKERLPKEYYKNLLSSFTTVIPTLTEKSLKNAVAYQKRKNILLQHSNDNRGQVKSTPAYETLLPAQPTSADKPSKNIKTKSSSHTQL